MKRKLDLHLFGILNRGKSIAIACLFVIFSGFQDGSSCTAAETNQALLPEGLRLLVEEALGSNEELQGLAENVKAISAEAPFAGSLTDPVIGFSLANLPVDTFDLDQEPMTQKQIFISQKVPWFGKLSLSQQAAELSAAEQYHMYRAKQLELIRRISQLWYDLDFIERSLATNDQLQQIISQILRIAETRYATGEGLQQDILAGQVQLSTLLDEQIRLQSDKSQYQARIGELLNSDRYYQRTPAEEDPSHIDLGSIGREALTQKALAANPYLRSRELALQRAEIVVRLAEKEYGPDMDFRLAYGQREDDPSSGGKRADLFSATVSFTLPLWQSSRQDSKLKAALLRQSSAQKQFSSLQKTLPHRIEALITEIQAARENQDLLQNVMVLQSEQQADSSLSAYAVGKISFDSMLSARIQTLRYQLQAEKYYYLALKKQAELNELSGEPAEFLNSFSLTDTTPPTKENNE